MKNSAFEKDLYRWYGEEGESLKRRLFRPREISYMYFLRKMQSASNPVAKAYYKFRLHRLSLKTNIQISSAAKIGEGFYIGHTGRIIINPQAVLGKNINIATGVVIGRENRGEREGAPTIGDNCWIGANSVIVGKVNIGNDVFIAPLTFVNFDVPDHSIVIGNPAKISPKENATLGYINRTV